MITITYQISVETLAASEKLISELSEITGLEPISVVDDEQK